MIFFKKLKEKYFLKRVANEKEKIEFFKKILLPSEMVFDIGANIGDFSDLISKAGVYVIAVEPNEECIKIMNKRFEKHSKVMAIVGEAVGSSIGEIELKINSKNPTLSTCSSNWNNGRFKNEVWDKKATVCSTTLDYLIEAIGFPKYIKIDIEGFEEEALKGLHYKVPYISFEFTKEFSNNAKKCIDICKKIDPECKFNYSIGESYKFQLKNWLNKEEMKKEIDKWISKDLWGDIYCLMKRDYY